MSSPVARKRKLSSNPSPQKKKTRKEQQLRQEKTSSSKPQHPKRTKKNENKAKEKKEKKEEEEEPMEFLEGRDAYEKLKKYKKKEREGEKGSWEKVEIGDGFLRGNMESGFFLLESLEGDSANVFSDLNQLPFQQKKKKREKKKKRKKEGEQIRVEEEEEEEEEEEKGEEEEEERKDEIVQNKQQNRKRKKNEISQNELSKKKRKLVQKGEEEKKEIEMEDVEKEDVEEEEEGVEEEENQLKTKKKKRKRKKASVEVTGFANLSMQRNVGEEEEEEEEEKEEEEEEEEEEKEIVVGEAWKGYGLCDQLLKGIGNCSFLQPTPIQKRVLQVALPLSSSSSSLNVSGKDVIGAAETGSGKTLAFGLPMLQRIISVHSSSPGTKRTEGKLLGLVISPTRELAMQITDHLRKVSKFSSVRICTIVGGLAEEKQTRLLSYHPEIVVGTPGRLWNLIKNGNPYLADLRGLEFLIIDEADRMLEKSHFAELHDILSLLRDCGGGSGPLPTTPSPPKRVANPKGAQKKNKKRQEEEEEEEEVVEGNEEWVRQTLVVSATMTLDVAQKLKQGNSQFSKKKKKKNKQKDRTAVTELLDAVAFKREIESIDLTTSKVLASGLHESKVECLIEDKDFYVYYFLLRYPARTLIFVNSIDCLRRLSSILRTLKIDCLTLHAEMQQRQRLKSMDRLKADPKAVMVCTDVAARGLDVPEVEHVIHYQVPRTSELYIHRSGRSARGTTEGLSLLLVGEKERDAYKKIIFVMGRTEEMPNFPINPNYFQAVRSRVQLARRLDKASHSQNKVKSEEGWLKKLAEEADLDFDDDLEYDLESKSQKKHDRQIASLRRELDNLLAQPLFPKGSFSPRYVTLGTMLQGNQSQQTKSAVDVLSARKP